jgi:hypothetical protein
MEIDSVLGAAAVARHFINPDLQYISLVIDVGSTGDGKPKFWVYESDYGKQLSLVVRGLRPSHVTSSVHDKPDDLDRAFVRLITGPVKPPGDGADVSLLEAELHAVQPQDILLKYGPDLQAWSKPIIEDARKMIASREKEAKYQTLKYLLQRCDASLANFQLNEHLRAAQELQKHLKDLFSVSSVRKESDAAAERPTTRKRPG